MEGNFDNLHPSFDIHHYNIIFLVCQVFCYNSYACILKLTCKIKKVVFFCKILYKVMGL